MADLTTQILIEIRDEIRTTNTRLDRLERRQTEAEIRVSTALVEAVGAVHQMRDAFLGDRLVRETVGNHEQRLQALERRP